MAIITENNGDANADSGTRYSISLGDVFQGTLEPADDKDWVRVELSEGTIYDFTLSDVDSARFELFDAAGNRIVRGGATSSGAKLIFSPDATATYYIQAGSTDDAFSGGYELSLVENTIPVGSYDEIADYLADGYWEWLGGSRVAFPVGPGGTLTADISVLPEAGRQLARWAFEAWTNVTGIGFEVVEDNNADIIFTNEPDDLASGGPTAVRNGLIIAAGVNIPDVYYARDGSSVDSFTFYVFLHEIGHALGLGHSGPYPADPDTPAATFGIENIYLIDSYQASVMSYIHQVRNTYIDASFAVNVTPMIADIIAIQDLYGVPAGIRAGDTVYGYQSNLDGYLGEFFKLWTGEESAFIGVALEHTHEYPTVKPAFADLDGDGDADLVIGKETAVLYYFENTGTSADPAFTERTGTANPLDGIAVGYYGAPAFTDLDGDGDQDLVVGNSNGADRHGEIVYLENTGTATSPGFTQRTGAANPFDHITIASWCSLAFADLDGDGDPDLVVGNEDGDVHYHENVGTPANPEFALRSGESSPVSDINAEERSVPVLVDLDHDDDYDLVIGNRQGKIYYFENTGTTTNPAFTQRIASDNPFHVATTGRYAAPALVDLDGDGDHDLAIGQQNGLIPYFENTGTPARPGFSAQHLANPTTFTIYDNGGHDTLDLRTDTEDQRVDLGPEGISDVFGLTGNLVIARDTVIEDFIAGSGDDLIAGNAVANHLNGRDGDDRLWGSGGDDILEGGAGADRLDGDAGLDRVTYRGSDAAVTVKLDAGTAMGGHAEGDVLAEIENVTGSDYGDVLWGDGGANRLEGGAGNDELRGNGGDDRLDGGAGADMLDGGPGPTCSTAGRALTCSTAGRGPTCSTAGRAPTCSTAGRGLIPLRTSIQTGASWCACMTPARSGTAMPRGIRWLLSSTWSAAGTTTSWPAMAAITGWRGVTAMTTCTAARPAGTTRCWAGTGTTGYSAARATIR